MPRFIKFIESKIMNIVNVEDISGFQFLKPLLKITMALKSSEIVSEFTYFDEESFKIQCDEIMRQLEL